jgi:hypothetical protein
MPPSNTLKPLIDLVRPRDTCHDLRFLPGVYEDSADLLDAEAAYSVCRKEQIMSGGKPRAFFVVIFQPLEYSKTPSDFVPTPCFRGRFISTLSISMPAPRTRASTYEDTVKTGQVGGQGGTFAYLWHPSYAAARKTNGSKRLCAMPACWTIGVRKDGRNFAAPLAVTTSFVIEIKPLVRATQMRSRCPSSG